MAKGAFLRLFLFPLHCCKRYLSAFEPEGSFSSFFQLGTPWNFSAPCILVPVINEITIRIPSSVSFSEKQCLEKYPKMKRKLLMNYEQPFRLMLLHGAVTPF